MSLLDECESRERPLRIARGQFFAGLDLPTPIGQLGQLHIVPKVA